jgi:hypothetical protein
MRKLNRAAIAFLLTSVACSDTGATTPPDGEEITLTVSQAAALVSKVESFGSLDPTLMALSDTVDVAIKAGAKARRIEITGGDLANNVFYAVSLHRTTKAGSSTFDVVAFNDPSSPSQFIILGGWALGSEPGTGRSAPSSVSGAIGGGVTTSLTGHLFIVAGDQLSAWHATGGTSSLSASATQEPCAGFAGPGTCVKSNMDATFNIIATSALQSTGPRTVSGTMSGIPGIRLSF